MSDKENYFPPNTPQDTINNVLYTDHGNTEYDPYEALESDLNTIEGEQDDQ